MGKSSQDVENQNVALREWAEHRGFELVAVYEEQESAWRAGHQHALSRLFADLPKRKVDICLVWALKREEIISKKAKKKLVTSTGGANPRPCQNSDKAAIDTKKEIAKLAGVSHDTVWKVKQIEEKAPKEHQ